MTQEASRPFIIGSGEHRLRSENLAFDIDVWYPPLAEHTFHTVFLPLTRLEAQAIVTYYNKVFRHVEDGSFTDSVVETLLALEARIDQALIEESFVSPDDNDGSRRSGGAFLRLCGRSPKDGEPTDPMIRAKIWESYCANLRTLTSHNAELNNDDDEHGNARVAAIAQTDSLLHVNSGSDAMSLLLTSERVFSDMLDWHNYGEPEQIVLRQFCGSFNLSTEFRCYIQSGVLRGISQYDTYARYSFLLDASKRDIVVQSVVKEWIKVKDCIQTMDDSYCIDFGVDMERKRALLIEISPYRCCTGPALFAWKGEAELVFPDRQDVHDHKIASVIIHEQLAKDAVFRIRSQVIPRIGDLVEMNWDYRWSKERVDTPKPYRDVYAAAITTSTNLVDRFSCWLFGERGVQQHVLFVYGTLKRNCHWHSKYMTGAKFLGIGTTVTPQSLVIGQCGVPYLIRTSSPDSEAKPVKGELWSCTSEMLQGIDEYEGIHKDHYSRQEIAIVVTGRSNRIQKAFCYFYAVKPGASGVDASLLQAERISEYTVEEQKKQYKPIHHIQVKQMHYLGEEATT